MLDHSHVSGSREPTTAIVGRDRYEQREANYLAMVTIAAIVLLWLE
jgi:hypothetical protein